MRPTACIYCGKDADTRDHVPPKCFLRTPYPANLITVPSCRTCNNNASKDEEYCRVVVIGLLCHTKEADLLFDGPMARSMDRNIDIETLMFGALEVVDTRVLLDVNYARIYRIAEKIARGLEFSTKGAMFPSASSLKLISLRSPLLAML